MWSLHSRQIQFRFDGNNSDGDYLPLECQIVKLDLYGLDIQTLNFF